jgi:CheY-like chemotaxis protein
MVVDNHAAFRRVIRAILETAGWECVECQDGQEAVEKYARLLPDLVLMDIAMENLDGLCATAQIKANFPTAKVMMLTELDDPYLRAAAEEAGACGYILKEDLLGLPGAIETSAAAKANQHWDRSSRESV